MRILFLTHSFNSLAQRLYAELTERGHEVSIELDINDAVTIEAARLLHDAGVDVVNVSDSPMARVRMGALAVALVGAIIVGDLLIEPDFPTLSVALSALRYIASISGSRLPGST